MSNPRVFKFQTAGGTAQPLIATTLTAAITPCTIATATSGTAGQSIAVADSSIFQVGDFVNIIPVAGSTTPARETQVPITAIPDGTHIVALNSAPHNSGDWVQLWWPCAQVRVQEQKSNPPAGSLFIGVDGTVTTAGDYSFEDIAVDFTFLSPIRYNNSDNVSNYWIISSSGSPKYLVSLWEG